MRYEMLPFIRVDLDQFFDWEWRDSLAITDPNYLILIFVGSSAAAETVVAHALQLHRTARVHYVC
jgi:hypothetical protein